jgi:hypothetical protein
LNALVYLSLARQPLPERRLTLELLESNIGAVPVGLSPIFIGWSKNEYDRESSELGIIATPTEGKGNENVTTSETSLTTETLDGEDGEEETGAVAKVSQMGMLADVDDTSFNSLDFSNLPSQEI